MDFVDQRMHVAGRRRSLAVIAILIGLGGMFSSLHTANAAEPAAVITLNNKLKFVPAKVKVKVGDTVRWKNASVLVHTVTDDPNHVAKDVDYALPEGARPFNSGNLKPKATYEHTFSVPGTYKYFCIPHEAAGMVAEVVVTK